MSFRSTPSIQKDIYIHDFIENYKDEIRIDPAFQSSEYSRWDDRQKSAYITSLIRGMAPSKYIFADVESCYESAVEDHRHNDVKYFQDWKDRGVKYLNIDSNNRVINLAAFVDGEFGLELGEYEMHHKGNDIPYTVEKGHNTFDEIHPILSMMFMNSQITLQIYTQCTREELSALFCRINDGKPLNNHEKRNAQTTPIAVVIRNLCSDWKDVLTHKDAKWFTKEEKIRRGIDGFVASLAYDWVNGGDLNSGCTPKTVWNMYVNDLGYANENAHRFEETFNRFMREVMSHKNVRAANHKNMIYDLWHIWLEQQNEGLSFIDKDAQERFVETFINATGQLLGQTTAYKSPGKKPWDSPKTFKTMIGGRQPNNNVKRNQLVTERMEIVDPTGMASWFIKIPHRTKGVGAAHTRQAAAARQENKTPEGKPIDFSKLHDGQTFHNGHIIPNADGGDSSLDNTVIQTKEDNLKLGRKQVDRGTMQWVEDVA